jgi:trk system potassium uptake protein TrkA
MVSSMLSDCSIVCPKENTAAIILRYLRAVENTDGGSIKTLYKILGGAAEAVEFIASAECPLVGKSLKEINLKPNIIIACISHQKEVIIPDGNTVINKGDSVIVITAGTPLTSLTEILE